MLKLFPTFTPPSVEVVATGNVYSVPVADIVPLFIDIPTPALYVVSVADMVLLIIYFVDL